MPPKCGIIGLSCLRGARCTMKKDFIYRLFSRIPPLETEHLRLRAMRVADASDMFAYARRADVAEFLTWEPHECLEFTRSYLTYVSQRYRTGDFYDWALIHKGDDRMIGTCGFTSFNYAADSGEIGYVLSPDYQGRGLATEAARAVLAFGFDTLRLHRIEAHFIEGNLPSLRLMQRLGMTLEGYAREAMKIKGIYRTIGTAAILAGEFRRPAP